MNLSGTNVLDFFDANYNFKSFEFDKTIILETGKTRPVKYVLKVISKSNIERREEEYRVLYKKGDDLRKDFLIFQSLELIKKASFLKGFFKY